MNTLELRSNMNAPISGTVPGVAFVSYRRVLHESGYSDLPRVWQDLRINSL
jgi:hypothetical protein